MSTKSTFESDINFCPQCGSIMPLPGAEDVVTCTKCKYQVDIIGEHCDNVYMYFLDAYV